MLDAFIIDKIRQDREQQRKGVPMRIHVPNPEDDPRWREQQQRQQKEKEEKGPSRGVTIIDYSI